MTKITRMVRFGARLTVWLSCGHTFRCGWDDAQRQQLFIGKPIECPDCILLLRLNA